MSRLEKIVKKTISRLACVAGLSLVLSSTNCSNSPVFNINHGRVIENIDGAEPQGRFGAFFTPIMGVSFPNPNNLGKHSYVPSFSEKNSIIYTNKAGFIDIAHLRKAADWTAFLAAKSYENLKNNQEEFTFNLKEPSIYHVKIKYPENWQNFSEEEREKIMFESSVKLGQYFSYTATTWHEILTWFGYSSTGLVSDFPSAFSWEDQFSNLLGTHVAVQALQDSQHEYNESITLALEKQLKELDAQPSSTAKKATREAMRLWTKSFLGFTDMKKRNFDIGENGFVTAWNPLSNPQLQPLNQYPVPNLDFSREGFLIKLELDPREWEKDKILNIIYPDKNPDARRDRLEPTIHFPLIMDYIRRDAIKKYGVNVDKPF